LENNGKKKEFAHFSSKYFSSAFGRVHGCRVSRYGEPTMCTHKYTCERLILGSWFTCLCLTSLKSAREAGRMETQERGKFAEAKDSLLVKFLLLGGVSLLSPQVFCPVDDACHLGNLLYPNFPKTKKNGRDGRVAQVVECLQGMRP
jgi:hypothetical protein